MDLEGSYTRESQAGRRKLWYMRYVPNINVQSNILTDSKRDSESKVKVFKKKINK